MTLARIETPLRFSDRTIYMQFLKPHTKKWFAAFARLNPWQAALTMELLRTAPSSDVCSFCGAKPAHDYCLSGTTPKTQTTCRLCDDCVRVRKASFREKITSVHDHENCGGLIRAS